MQTTLHTFGKIVNLRKFGSSAIIDIMNTETPTTTEPAHVQHPAPATVSAANVSRQLRAAGITTLLPVARQFGHEGVFVYQCDTTVTVSIGLATPAQCRRAAEDITSALTGQGYTVEPNPHDADTLTISH